jgi:hypothetical protein
VTAARCAAGQPGGMGWLEGRRKKYSTGKESGRRRPLVDDDQLVRAGR